MRSEERRRSRPIRIEQRELGRKREQDADAGDAQERIAQRDGNGRSDDLLDDRRVDRDSRSDFGRAIFLEEAGRKPQQVAVHGEADVGDRSLAQPGHEIKADCSGDSQDADQQEQIFEPARDIAGGSGTVRKAFVDDQLERVGDAGSRCGGDQQRERSDCDMAGIASAKLHTIRRFLIERPFGRFAGFGSP